jgi:hypothetical protein
MKSSLYYFPYWFPGIIMQIINRQEVERTRTSEMFMLYFTWSYCKQLASNVKLATGKCKIIVASWAPLRYYFSRIWNQFSSYIWKPLGADRGMDGHIHIKPNEGYHIIPRYFRDRNQRSLTATETLAGRLK